MFFFFRRPKIVVDAFIRQSHCHLHEYFPVESANHFIPEWWKKAPKGNNTELMTNKKSPRPKETTSVRRCSGIVDYYNSNSIIIPLWMSCVLEYSSEDSKFGQLWASQDQNIFIKYHEPDMRGPDYAKNFHHFKFISPWKFKEKSGINFYFGQAFYNFDIPDEVVMPPGILNYKYQHATEINFFVRKPLGQLVKKIEFKAGQPLAYVLPITEKKLELRTHVIPDDEYFELTTKQVFFSNSYNVVKKIKEKNEKKCPFGFGK